MVYLLSSGPFMPDKSLRYITVDAQHQILVAAVQMDDKRLLLFLTDDPPCEDALNIALIDLNDGVKENLILGSRMAVQAPYPGYVC